MGPVDRAESLDRLATGRVGRLATIRPDGSPHVVPVTYAISPDSVYTMIDHKPKKTDRLQRLTNIEKNPAVSLVADHWSEIWTELWWVRVDGHATIHQGDEAWDDARKHLVAKYEQYRERPPQGVAIRISIERVSSWSGSR